MRALARALVGGDFEAVAEVAGVVCVEAVEEVGGEKGVCVGDCEGKFRHATALRVNRSPEHAELNGRGLLDQAAPT